VKSAGFQVITGSQTLMPCAILLEQRASLETTTDLPCVCYTS